jgi:hypothetical protein
MHPGKETKGFCSTEFFGNYYKYNGEKVGTDFRYSGYEHYSGGVALNVQRWWSSGKKPVLMDEPVSIVCGRDS